MVKLNIENNYLPGPRRYVLNFGQTRKVGELLQELANRHTPNGMMMMIDMFIDPSHKVSFNELSKRVHEIGLRNGSRVVVMPKR